MGYYRTQDSGLFPNCRSDKKKEYIQKINVVLDFIDINYAEDISLDKMADMHAFFYIYNVRQRLLLNICTLMASC